MLCFALELFTMLTYTWNKLLWSTFKFSAFLYISWSAVWLTTTLHIIQIKTIIIAIVMVILILTTGIREEQNAGSSLKRKTLYETIWLYVGRWYAETSKCKKPVAWALSGETDLRACPAVGVARPQQSDQVEAEESAQKRQHHVVLGHSGKQLCSARNVHLVWHHKEGAPEESEVVTQTLSQLRSALLSHLRQRKQVTVWGVNTGASSTLLQSNTATEFPRVKKSPGSHQCSMSPSLRPRTGICSWKKRCSVSGPAPRWNWRAGRQHTRLQESAATSPELSSSENLLLQKSAKRGCDKPKQ